MPNTVLIGAQWGDEGKGKIVDVLAGEADVVVRYQGGGNAGHTVVAGDARHVLHLAPSGILHPGKVCVIGNGVVMDPFALLAELDGLRERGIESAGRLLVSGRAHLVMSWHRALDAAEEAARPAGRRIGTTGRGIGPAYAAKAARTGMRACGVLRPGFLNEVRARTEEANARLRSLGAPELDADAAVRECAALPERLGPYVADTVAYLHAADRAGKNILLEGAQGTMLDIDFGTYPFVTSSSASAGGACTGSGLPPRRIDRVVGVLKCYTTRVGEGPFPTELDGPEGEALRTRGGEFGATTGRPRRCGWFDAVAARYSALVNGVDFWAMTKLDVLDGLPELKICTAYERDDGKRLDSFPADLDELGRCRPVYETMPGWEGTAAGAGRYEDLPPAARAYIERLAELTGPRIGMISVGAGRENTIRRGI